MITKYSQFSEIRKQSRRRAVSRRRRKLKEMVVEHLGGKCFVCGYNRCIAALDAHHIDPSIKSFGLSQNGLTRSWEAIKAEADKCKLLCANCHREEHHGRDL